MKVRNLILISSSCFLSVFSSMSAQTKASVEYVNPYMGNISHLLVPTFPTIHLPNSMLRVYPERSDFTGDLLHGLPIIVTSHRGSSAFKLSPFQGKIADITPVNAMSYDNEVIKPYYYKVRLDEMQTDIQFAPSHQSAMYQIDFDKPDSAFLVLSTSNGQLSCDKNTISGYQNLDNNTKVYVYLELNKKPIDCNTITTDRGAYTVVALGKNTNNVTVKYGISFIDATQAKKNMVRELNNKDLKTIVTEGANAWNNVLDKINVTGNENDKTIFYTSLYRCFERPVNISEDGRYFSAFDGKIHEDNGTPFYTDDWIWDTYRATHPLRIIMTPQVERDMINSYLRMAEQMPNFWMPTFPEITGDSRRMNSNHGVATIADAQAKNLGGFNLQKAYDACKNAITEKTLAPWSAKPAGELDQFYVDKGYIPALKAGEKETIPEVHGWEKRQPIAVTLGTAYDEWCLSQIAKALNNEKESRYFAKRAYNYRNVFNEKTKFFHPKDKEGKFLDPFDYRYDGGPGAREFYGENNGWVYRWDVPHNVADLIVLMGGRDAFNKELDQTFREPLGKSKYDFYSQLPDHTGNVGQFSMANEPSLHIPYLYNYSGQPWKTQKRIRTLLNQWFRNDLMGIPGDEDGGGMSAFVAFSTMGFYPITPGFAVYNIGSPVFERTVINLDNGKTFEIVAENYSEDNKYIQSAVLNGKEHDKPWFTHEDLINGGKLILRMGKNANFNWGTDAQCAPPSAE
ncbi:MAG: GH92 family glycosyl hydrolase [Tannerellaceae bacterium]